MILVSPNVFASLCDLTVCISRYSPMLRGQLAFSIRLMMSSIIEKVES